MFVRRQQRTPARARGGDSTSCAKLWLVLALSLAPARVLAAPGEAEQGETERADQDDPNAGSEDADEEGEEDEEGEDEQVGEGAGEEVDQSKRERRPPRGEVDPETRVIEVSTGTRTAREAATAPVATTVVTRQDIVDSGAETLAEALEHSDPSIQLTEGIGGTELSLRGFDPEQVLVLVDGQRVTGRVDGTIDLSRFSIETVERVEIVQGAGSVLHGSAAVGGVVNIVTRDPEPGVDAELHGAYGSRNTIDTSARVAGGMRRWQLAAFGGYHRTDGWDADPSDVATTGDRVSWWNAGASGHVQPVPELRVSLDGNYLQRDSRGVELSNTGAVLDRGNLSKTADTTLEIAWVTGDSRLRATAHYNLFHDLFAQDQRGDDDLDQIQPTWDHIAQFGLQYDQMAGTHVLTTGLDAQVEWLYSERLVAEQGSREAERQRVALFVQDEWTPKTSPRISVLPALRVDYDSRFGVYPTGRLALLVAPVETLTMRVAYGRGYRAPSFREMYLSFVNAGVGYRVVGNPGLEPEQAWTFDLGMTWTPSDTLRFELGVFDNQLRDLITVDLVNTGGTDEVDVFGYVNVGSGSIRGVEASGFVRLWRYFEIEGGYTLIHARDVATDLPLPGRAAHQTTFALRFHQRSWGTRAVVRGRVTGRRAFATSEDQPTEYADPFASIDIRISQSFLRYLSAFVGVENLLDAGNAQTNPIAPRAFYGGLTFRY